MTSCGTPRCRSDKYLNSAHAGGPIRKQSPHDLGIAFDGQKERVSWRLLASTRTLMAMSRVGRLAIEVFGPPINADAPLVLAVVALSPETGHCSRIRKLTRGWQEA